MSAYSCEPGKGSEPGVGWNMALAMCKYHNVWVITRSENKIPIEKYLKLNPVENLKFVYFDLPIFFIRWQKNQRGIRTHYYFWQLFAYFTAQKLHEKVRFDLGHHVSMVMYWMPSFFMFMNIPFIWGTVGGGEAMPANFYKYFPLRTKIYESARSIAQLRGELDPFVRLTSTRAAIVFASTFETAARIRKMGRRDVLVQPSVALSLHEIEQVELFESNAKNQGKIRVILLGRLVPCKAFSLGVRVAKQLRVIGVEIELRIVGDGVERTSLERQVQSSQLSDAVKFYGEVDRATALTLLSESDVLLQTSLHDSGGFVVLEAMSLSKPVIALDIGGQSLQVDSETGIKIPVTTPDEVVTQMVSAIMDMVNNNARWLEKGKNGRKKIIRKFTWESRGRFYDQVYRTLINSNSVDSKSE